MATQQNKPNEIKGKELTANHVDRLTMQTLQQHFELQMSQSQYCPQDIWDVVVGAAVQTTTIDGACRLFAHSPSPNTVRTYLGAVLPKHENLYQLEDSMNDALINCLPKNFFRRSLPVAVDITDIPYHGIHDDDDPFVRRSKAKHGTTHFHCYATLYVVKHNRRYTLAIAFMYREDFVLDVLKRLFQSAQKLGLKCRRLLLDREFDNNSVVRWLKTQSFPSIIPLTIRGRSGGARFLLETHKSVKTEYTRNSKKYGKESFDVFVVRKYKKGRYNQRVSVCFAYVVIGVLRMQPLQVFQEYRKRFGIESSYRMMNQVRARTSSKSPVLRLFYVGLALLLLNLWMYIKWSFLFILHKKGPREIIHEIFPLKRFSLWLWECLKQRLSLILSLKIPIASHIEDY